MKYLRERDRERHTHRDRDREGDTERDRDRETETDRQTDRWEPETHRETEMFFHSHITFYATY